MNWKQTICCMLSLLVLGTMGSVSVLAQVVTPSLDPTEPVIYPGAAGWRKMKSIGVGYNEASGLRKRSYTDGSGDTDLYDFDTTGYTGNIALGFEGFALEGSTMSRTITVKQDLNSSYNTMTLSETDSKAHLVLSGEKFVSIGIGTHLYETVTVLDDKNDKTKVSQTGTTGGISIALGEALTVGGAIEKVKESGNKTVDNTWSDYTSAIALQLGSKGGNLFRLEYSFTNSPESNRDASDGKLASSHPKSTYNRVNLELMFSGLLFTAKSHKQTIGSDTTKSLSEGGVLWIPPDGLLLGFYFNEQKQIVSSDTFKTTDTFNEFSIRIGQVF